MANDEHPTINDFLARLYTVRDEAGERTREGAKAIVTRNAAKDLLRSGATLKMLAELIEKEFDKAITEMLATLRHMKSIPGVDYQACRDQAFLRARDLIPVMRSASGLDKWIGSIGRGAAGDAINKASGSAVRQDSLPLSPIRRRSGPSGRHGGRTRASCCGASGSCSQSQ